MTDTAPPIIEPVADQAARPLWSVMIPTFNCAHQVGETLESVLSQAPSADAMEIVVVDDASTDDIEQAVKAHGDRVRLHRQPSNLGVPHNLTEAIRLSRGRLVHILHGDDQVRPGFYAAMEQAFADAEIGAAFCRQIYTDSNGRWQGLSPLETTIDGRIPDALQHLASEQRIMTPSICVRREVYERIGGFHPALSCAEDWEMWVRIARHYAIGYVAEPLAVYRMQDASNTGRNMRSGAVVDMNRKAIAIISEHLPQDIAARIVATARATYAKSALHAARDFAGHGDGAAARAQFQAALRLSHAPRVLVDAGRTLLSLKTNALLWRMRGKIDAV